MNEACDYIKERLFSMQDEGYRTFHSRLMPTIDPARIIGVRTPQLRALAREFSRDPRAADFLAVLPHVYYEENNLHAMLLERMRDLPALFAALDTFLPFVDNWATCDLMSPAVFRKRPPELLSHIRTWMASDHTYTIRFGVGMLMRHYLDDGFSAEYPAAVAAVKSEEYYVNMMLAWYFATALAKQYDAVLPYLTERRLPVWVHNKTIRKAIESYRITSEQKAYLRTLTIKEKQTVD